MAFIYDLDNEYGGVILSDTGSPGPALRVDSNTAAQPALAVLSTASGIPVQITAISGGAGIDVDSKATDFPAADFKSNVTTGQALVVGRTVASSPTVAPMIINHSSAASAPVIEFGSFVSVTSVVLTSVANVDYVVRVKVGDTYRSIPLIKDAGVIGSAAF